MFLSSYIKGLAEMFPKVLPIPLIPWWAEGSKIAGPTVLCFILTEAGFLCSIQYKQEEEQKQQQPAIYYCSEQYLPGPLQCFLKSS